MTFWQETNTLTCPIRKGAMKFATLISPQLNFIVFDDLPESLSVSVKMKKAVSFFPTFFAFKMIQPSGWQKLTTLVGNGKS